MFDTVDYHPLFIRDQGESVLDTHFNETGSLVKIKINIYLLINILKIFNVILN